MTEKTSGASEQEIEVIGNDQAPLPFSYGHGRMPFFMKLVWIGFLALITWYTVKYLLTAVGQEIG